MRKTRERAEERLERSKLREFFEDVHRPNLERDQASSSHLEIHTAAVEHLERFCKRPLAPDDVDEQVLLNFDSYLWRQGLSDNRRRNLVESLRRICAAYRPAQKLYVNRRRRRTLPPPAAGTVRSFYEERYVPERLAGRSLRHIEDGQAVLYSLHEQFGRDVRLEEQTDALASVHVTWLQDRGLGPVAINRRLGVWFAVWRYARLLGCVATEPLLKKLPQFLDSPDAWSPEEIAAILDNCGAAWHKPIAGIAAADWWRALLLTVWYTGLRRRALMELRRADVDTKSGWLRVRASTMKNRRGKPFRVGPDCIGAIVAIWDPPRELLFDFPHDKTTFYKQFNRIIDAAGVPRGDSNAGCLHKIRRSAATAIAATQGIGAAQTILGHRSMAVTERYIDQRKLPATDFSKALPKLPTKTNRITRAGA